MGLTARYLYVPRERGLYDEAIANALEDAAGALRAGLS
jgi:hypothetical protein